ncbi:hypothetical protein YC2023_080415 [Brassica napus]
MHDHLTSTLQGRFIKTRIVEILKLLKYFVHIATVSLVIRWAYAPGKLMHPVNV